MEQKTQAELFAELEQRLLLSRMNTREAMRRLDEVFYSAERVKREIRLRQLRRLSRSHAM